MPLSAAISPFLQRPVGAPAAASWRRRPRWAALPLALTLLAACEPSPAGGRAADLTLVQRIPLPGASGRLDHMALDADGGRLFIAAPAADAVAVVDLRTGRLTGILRGFHEPQGVLCTSGRLYVANGAAGTCDRLDLHTLKRLPAIRLDGDVDNLRADGPSGVAVGCGAGSLVLLDARTGRRRAAVALGAHPEAFCLEEHGPRAWVNVPDARAVVVVDRLRGTVLARRPLRAASGNYAMALDEARRRLFVACRRPACVIVLDADTGAEIDRRPIADDADDAFYDPSGRRLFLSCGAGVLHVFACPDNGRLRPMDGVPTAPGARTSLYVPARRRLYVAAPARPNRPAQILVYSVD